jgi:Zinc finger, C2H2 type
MSPSKGLKPGNYECDICEQKEHNFSKFDDIHSYKLHSLLEHGIISYRCPHCDNYFSKVQLLKRHVQNDCKNNKVLEDQPHVDPSPKRVRLLKSETNSESLNMCVTCGKKFSRVDNLKRHIKAQVCTKSKVKFKTSNSVNENKNEKVSDEKGVISDENINKCTSNLNSNLATIKKLKKFVCENCNKSFSNNCVLKRHINQKVCIKRENKIVSASNTANLNSHPSTSNTSKLDAFLPNNVILVETAFKGRLNTYHIKNLNKNFNPLEYLEKQRKNIQEIIRKNFHSKSCLKVNLHFECEHTNVVGETLIKNFKTKNVALYKISNLEDFVDRSFKKLNTEMSEHASKKSGWTFHKVNSLEVRVNEFNPLKANKYVPLPEKIKSRKATINVVNKDNYCFFYAILAKFLNDPYILKNYDENNIPYIYK